MIEGQAHDKRASAGPGIGLNAERVLYSGDHPNPLLNEFAQGWNSDRSPSETSGRMQEHGFDRNIRTSKLTAIYGLHSYHLGKKPHDAIAQHIDHFTEPRHLVLDPFCGSGSTALASLLQGRRAIAIDASPAATFITRFYLERTDPESLRRRFDEMVLRVREEMDFLYGTSCHRCGGPAFIHHVIYSSVYPCPGCGRLVSLFEARRTDPACCPWCRTSKGVTVKISTRLQGVGTVPVAVTFSCRRQCSRSSITRSCAGTAEERRAFATIDLARIEEIERLEIPHWYPPQYMMNVARSDCPWGDEWRPSRNFRRVADLFTVRNLWAYAALFEAAAGDDDLRAVLTSAFHAVSRKAQHLSGGGGYIPGNWALPPVSKQRNVLETVGRIFAKALRAKRTLSNLLHSQEACISTQSATDLSEIPDSRIDYIFTDPPYGGMVQYAELNFPWEAWLGFDHAWHDDEIIINRTRGKDACAWQDNLAKAMRECYRVLKPGGWLSLCYHGASWDMWGRVIDLMTRVGFSLPDAHGAVSIDTGSRTYNQRLTDKLVKRDLVISFRKTRPTGRAISGFRQPAGDTAVPISRVEAAIEAFLRSSPGAGQDRIFDHVVNVMLQTATFEPCNFRKALRKVAYQDPERGPGWFVASPDPEGREE
jgi:SAM-dependent methyltransferase